MFLELDVYGVFFWVWMKLVVFMGCVYWDVGWMCYYCDLLVGSIVCMGSLDCVVVSVLLVWGGVMF